jgi:hypothetical protein
MCGLFGAIGKSINPATIRALAIVNRKRGSDSLGLFDSTSKVKAAADPIEALGRDNFTIFLEQEHWFIAGHTRYATKGEVVKKNCHPFRFGNIIGAHNGQVEAPGDYNVDSQYLFDQLFRNNGNYAEAFKGIKGYWVLTWFDGQFFYLQAHDNKLTLARIGQTWYYSSDKEHLKACIGKADEWLTLENGATIRFNSAGRMAKLESFKSNAGRGGFRKSDTAGKKKILPLPATLPNYPSWRDSYQYQSAYQTEFQDNYDTLSLTNEEYEEANKWAHDLGYAGFYAFKSNESIPGELEAYDLLHNDWCLENQAIQEHDDAKIMDAEFYDIMDDDRVRLSNSTWG